MTALLTYAIRRNNRGFKHGEDVSPVVYNGTFAHNSDLAPIIGVQRGFYLQSSSRRREYGLPPLEGMARQDDKEQRQRNYISADADFIRFAVTVSTSADQMALAPGNLEREWTRSGKAFFPIQPRHSRIELLVSRIGSLRGCARRVAGRRACRLPSSEPRQECGAHARCDEAVAGLLHGEVRALSSPSSAHCGISEILQVRAVLSDPDTLFRGLWFPRGSQLIQTASTMSGTSRRTRWHINGGLIRSSARTCKARHCCRKVSPNIRPLMVMERRYGPHKMRQYLKHELDTYLSRAAAVLKKDRLRWSNRTRPISITRRARSQCMPSRRRSASTR